MLFFSFCLIDYEAVLFDRFEGTTLLVSSSSKEIFYKLKTIPADHITTRKFQLLDTTKLY